MTYHALRVIFKSKLHHNNKNNKQNINEKAKGKKEAAMTELKIRDIFKDFESVELFYIKADRDGNESIWRKCTKITDDEEKVLCDRFYHDASFRPELDTYEMIHTYLVDFLHKIEETRKEDIDDNTIITFNDDDQEKEAGMKEIQNKETNFAKYGQDAMEAWKDYMQTGNTDQIAKAIRDRLEVMQPELVKTFFTFGLVFAEKSR